MNCLTLIPRQLLKERTISHVSFYLPVWQKDIVLHQSRGFHFFPYQNGPRHWYIISRFKLQNDLHHTKRYKYLFLSNVRGYETLFRIRKLVFVEIGRRKGRLIIICGIQWRCLALPRMKPVMVGSRFSEKNNVLAILFSIRSAEVHGKYNAGI